MKRTLLILSAALLPSLPASGQDLRPDQVAAIDEIFQDLADPAGPGASVAVIRGGTIVYSRGFGSAQVEYGIPVEPTTIFHVASVSKQFTSMALLLLAEEGRVDLDGDIRTYLDWVPELGATVTPRHLLSHTSGIRDQWELLYTAGWRLDDVITKADVRRLMTKQRELNFQPGEEFLYSNMGYTLAAEIVEGVSGMPFQDFVSERIFRPLGMERTHVHDDHEHVVPGRAYSYRATEDGFENAVLSFANHGATSLFTTAEDLVVWLDNFRTRRVGGGVMREMTTPMRLNDGETFGGGLGVFVGEYRGRPWVQHGGSDAGFRSQVAWFPEDGVGIAVLTNLASGDPGGRTRKIADVVLADVLEAVTEPAAEEEPAPRAETVSIDPTLLERYAGTYTTEMVTISFEVRDGELWLTAPNTVRLLATSDTSFVADDPAAATFDFGIRDGVAERLLVVQGELRLEGTRVDAGALPDLAEFVGVYYSPEVEALYEVRRGEDGLLLYNLRRGELPLVHKGGDSFAGSQFFLSEVRFTRGEAGTVDGFRMTGSRVRNHRFVRLAEGALPGR